MLSVVTYLYVPEVKSKSKHYRRPNSATVDDTEPRHNYSISIDIQTNIQYTINQYIDYTLRYLYECTNKAYGQNPNPYPMSQNALPFIDRNSLEELSIISLCVYMTRMFAVGY